MKYSFIYITTNLINKKRYLGSHSTVNINDGYLGSGILLKRAIKKYKKQNFTRNIIEFTTKKNLLSAEDKWLQFYKPWENKKQWYNISNGACGSNTRAGYSKKNHKQYIQKLIDSPTCVIGKKGKQNHMYGKHHTKEWKRLRSKQQKEYIKLIKQQPSCWNKLKKCILKNAKKGCLKAAEVNRKPLTLIKNNDKKIYFKSTTECMKVLQIPSGVVCNLKRNIIPNKRKEHKYKYIYETYKVIT